MNNNTDNLNEYPTGYMTGFVTVESIEYASTVEGVKSKTNTWTLT